jgi:hypothetical protein
MKIIILIIVLFILLFFNFKLIENFEVVYSLKDISMSIDEVVPDSDIILTTSVPQNEISYVKCNQNGRFEQIIAHNLNSKTFQTLDDAKNECTELDNCGGFDVAKRPIVGVKQYDFKNINHPQVNSKTCISDDDRETYFKDVEQPNQTTQAPTSTSLRQTTQSSNPATTTVNVPAGIMPID